MGRLIYRILNIYNYLSNTMNLCFILCCNSLVQFHRKQEFPVIFASLNFLPQNCFVNSSKKSISAMS